MNEGKLIDLLHLLRERNYTSQDFFSYYSLDENGKKGTLYESLWFISIKFFLFPKATYYDRNTAREKGRYSIVSSWKRFLERKINVGNSSGKADITFEQDKEIHLATSKYDKIHQVDDLELDGLEKVGKDWKMETKLLVLVQNAEEVKKLFYRSRYWKQYNIHVFLGEKDLDFYLSQLHSLLQTFNNIEEMYTYLGTKKEHLSLRLHQRMTIEKLSGLSGISVVGHKARSGKSYLCAGDILHHGFKKVVIITSVLSPFG